MNKNVVNEVKSINLDDFKNNLDELKKEQNKYLTNNKHSMHCLILFIISYLLLYYRGFDTFSIINHLTFFVGFLTILSFGYFWLYLTTKRYKVFSDTVITQFSNLLSVMNNNPYFKLLNEMGNYKTQYPSKSMDSGVINLSKPLEFFTKSELEDLKKWSIEVNEFEFIEIIDFYLSKFKV